MCISNHRSKTGSIVSGSLQAMLSTDDLGGRNDGGEFLSVMLRGGSGTRMKSWVFEDYPREWGFEMVSGFGSTKQIVRERRELSTSGAKRSMRVQWTGLKDG